MSLDWVQGKGLSVDRDHYEMVYAMQREPGETLEDIYRRFNIDHPEDFRGHSLSVSDVVVLHENGADTTYYVDSIGFRERRRQSGIFRYGNSLTMQGNRRHRQNRKYRIKS